MVMAVDDFRWNITLSMDNAAGVWSWQMATLSPPESTLSRYEYISRISGMLSLSIWLFAQLPQIIENHLNQSVAGVLLLFLLIWVLGDATNLIGCVLTRALPFQICLAAYYCFIDCILGLQYWYYTRVFPLQPQGRHHNLLQSPDMLRPVKSSGTVRAHSLPRRNRFEYTETDLGQEDGHGRLPEVASPNSPFPIDNNALRAHRVPSSPRLRLDNRRLDLTGGSLIKKLLGSSFMAKSLTKPVYGFPVHKPTPPPSDAPKSLLDKFLLALHTVTTALGSLALTKEEIGTMSAWCCTCLYVSSRCPQIYRNFRNKSTKGILMYLFLFAMMGNTFYATSVVTDLYVMKLVDPSLYNKEVLVRLPFIIGSAGTVTFDIIILFQVWFYATPAPPHTNNNVHHHLNGHHHHNHNHANNNNHPLHSNNVGNHPRHLQNQPHILLPNSLDSPSLHPNRRNNNFPYTEDYYSALYDDDQDQLGGFMPSEPRRKSKHSHKKSLETFQKPDWYTNIYKNPHIGLNSPSSPFAHPQGKGSVADESTKLVNQFTQSYKNYVNPSPQLNPPSHYISGSASLTRSINVSSHSNIISNALNTLTRSMSSSSINNDYYMSGSLKNHNSGGTNIVSSSVTSSHLATSIIPSIVGNYSSLSRKMKDDTKVPFSPSDFLNDEFYHPTAGTLSDNLK